MAMDADTAESTDQQMHSMSDMNEADDTTDEQRYRIAKQTPQKNDTSSMSYSLCLLDLNNCHLI